MAKTLKDIAEKLNLSISTVSCALKDGPKVVSPDIRKKVRKAAKEIGYRPNRIARSLVTGRTHTIGVVPMFVESDTLLHPYQHLGLNGIFNAANESRHDVLVYTAQNHNRLKAVADDLLDSRADGVIFISPRPESPAVRGVADGGLPYVVLFENCGGQSFTVDNREGVLQALEHLFSLGHSLIGHVSGDLALSDGRLRYEAFIEIMGERQGPVPESHIVRGDFTRESGFKAGYEFIKLSPRPTAVLCGNDDIAFGFMEALQSLGIRCPEEVSVVGFDGVTPPGMAMPSLTTIRQPAQHMAAEAVRALVHNIESGLEVENRVFSPELIVRKSTAPVAKEGIH